MEGKEKLSSRLTAAIFKDLRLEIKELRKYQLIFVTAEEVLSKKINKGQKTALSLHSITRDRHHHITTKQKGDEPVQTSGRDSWLAKQIHTSAYL